MVVGSRPYYVELCGTSQFRSKLTGPGGVAGHAVMYIKGACKDEQASFPQLRRCRRVATDLNDPEHGAGVSVGRWFRNVNWVAVPGYKLFYRGNLDMVSVSRKPISMPRYVMRSTRMSTKASSSTNTRPREPERAWRILSPITVSAPTSRSSSRGRLFVRAFQ